MPLGEPWERAGWIDPVWETFGLWTRDAERTGFAGAGFAGAGFAGAGFAGAGLGETGLIEETGTALGDTAGDTGLAQGKQNDVFDFGGVPFITKPRIFIVDFLKKSGRKLLYKKKIKKKASFLFWCHHHVKKLKG